MYEGLDPLAVARQPTQQRARDRFDRILQEAERLLEEEGLSGFSIPVLAQRLKYTRGSVYTYFPTPYAILNELVSGYLERLEQVFIERGAELRRLNWKDGIAAVVELAAAFQNANPAARLLLLGGAVTDDGYRAQEITHKHLGDLGRGFWGQKGIELPTEPDVTTLSVELATACFRRSFFEHGQITPAYREAAVHAMIGFLQTYARAARARTPTSTKTRPAARPATGGRRRSRA